MNSGVCQHDVESTVGIGVAEQAFGDFLTFFESAKGHGSFVSDYS